MKTLEENPADIVFLQETHAGWADLLKQNERLAKLYPCRVWRHPHGNGPSGGTSFDPSGSGFLCRFPILSHRILWVNNLEGSFFPALECDIEVQLQRNRSQCNGSTVAPVVKSTPFIVRCLNVYLRPSIPADIPADDSTWSMVPLTPCHAVVVFFFFFGLA